MSESVEFSMSQLSLNSEGSGSQNEDWDRSLMNDSETDETAAHLAQTPRNSVAFPADGEVEGTPRGPAGTKGKRSLSELLRLHAEKGTECRFSQEEAARVAEVLGQWINASSSPYEDDDDFFAKGSQDDISLQKRSGSAAPDARPRGQSESVASRPSSSAGHAIKT